MARLIVTAPAAGYTGDVGAVHFRDGVAEADTVNHSAELTYMRNAGYLIDEPPEVEAPDDSAEPAEELAQPSKPKVAQPVADWRAYAVSKGLSVDEADAMTKNQLVERFTDESEDTE